MSDSVSLQSMLTVDEALEQVLVAFQALPAETIDIADGLNRVLVEDVYATQDLPPFANSSMDGYAVRAADVANAGSKSPVHLKVILDIPAGSYTDIPVGVGEAARIMTGAPMPPGADSVIPVEDTNHAPTNGHNSAVQLSARPATIAILKPGKPGDFVRPVGEDVKKGQRILTKGRVLRAADLGVLGGLGIPLIQVIRQPLVAILSTGDELLKADQPLIPGKTRDMNGYTIPALVQGLGARTFRLGVAQDRVEDVRAHLNRAVEAKVDLILSTAGVSVGAYDVVKTVVESLGALGFWKVKMRPGKPLAFGNIGGIPFLGLPGNPVSAMVSFDVFARPAILKMAGREWTTATVQAEIAESIRSDGRQTYMRVLLSRTADGSLVAHSTGNQSSGALTSLVTADGLLIIPEGMTDVPAGTHLPVRLFSNSTT